MKRREFVVATTGSGLTPLFAGCGSMTSDGVDLRVRNRNSRAHSYEVTATDYDGRSKSGRLAAGESATASDFLPYQDTAHSTAVAVAVDDTRIREVDIFVQSDVGEMSVDILDAETVEIGPDDVFSPTPPEQ